MRIIWCDKEVPQSLFHHIPLGTLTLDSKQPKFDVIDNLEKISIVCKLRERLLYFTKTKLFLSGWPILSKLRKQQLTKVTSPASRPVDEFSVRVLLENAPWSPKIDQSHIFFVLHSLCPSFRFFFFFFLVINRFRNKLLLSNQLEFQSNLFTNNPWKFEANEEMECVPILEFAEVTFRNLITFRPIFI